MIHANKLNMNVIFDGRDYMNSFISADDKMDTHVIVLLPVMTISS
mgnify:FL=1